MRFIVYGVGAIGGTIAASFALAGEEVVGIARGRQLDAIRAGGLLMRTPAHEHRVRFECVDAPSAVGLRDDDVFVLTMKTQDTYGALLSLRDAGVRKQPIVCAQNGVANERMALRLFPNVYGVTVIMPATYETAGVVNAFGIPKRGLFYVGRHPQGVDSLAEGIASGFARAEIACEVVPDIRRLKYGKLIMNLGNVVMAAMEPGAGAVWSDRVREEAKGVYQEAGIAWTLTSRADAKEGGVMHDTPIPGVDRIGSSSLQSLRRGAGSIETDYLNGEIVYLARSLGLSAPLNEWFCDLAPDLVSGRVAPCSVSEDMIPAHLRDGSMAASARPSA